MGATEKLWEISSFTFFSVQRCPIFRVVRRATLWRPAGTFHNTAGAIPARMRERPAACLARIASEREDRCTPPSGKPRFVKLL